MESFLQSPYQVGQAIRSGRVHQNYSQAWLAEKCHMSQPSLSKIEQGVASVTLAQFQALCSFLKLDVMVRKEGGSYSRLDLNYDPEAKPEDSDIGGITMEQLIGLCRRLDARVVVREEGKGASFYDYFTETPGDQGKAPPVGSSNGNVKSQKPEW